MPPLPHPIIRGDLDVVEGGQGYIGPKGRPVEGSYVRVRLHFAGVEQLAEGVAEYGIMDGEVDGTWENGFSATLYPNSYAPAVLCNARDVKATFVKGPSKEWIVDDITFAADEPSSKRARLSPEYEEYGVEGMDEGETAVAQSCKDRGNAAYAEGNYQEAVTLFTAALAASDLTEPLRIACLNNRSAANIMVNSWGAAEDDASECLRLDPEHVKAFWSRGIARENLGKLAAAAEDYAQVIHLLPSYEPALDAAERLLEYFGSRSTFNGENAVGGGPSQEQQGPSTANLSSGMSQGKLRLRAGRELTLCVTADVGVPLMRRLTVLDSLSLDELARVLVTAVGWIGTAPFVFVDSDDVSYGSPSPVVDKDAATTELFTLVDGGSKTLMFTYSAGRENWLHSIDIEDVPEVRVTDPTLHPPRLLAAEQAAPPEGVGGRAGYLRFLASIASDPPELSQPRIEWAASRMEKTGTNVACGRGALSGPPSSTPAVWDPKAVDLQLVNKELAALCS